MNEKIERLVASNSLGIFPGPEEEESTFFLRLEALSKKRNISKAENQFDIDSSLIPINYDNKGLSFFQGACLWISEENGYFYPKIQIRKKLPSFYSQKELLEHELVHAARIGFNEPIFEEILAYHTSKNKFRRFFGPIVRTEKESYVFIAVALLSMFLNVSFLFGFYGWLLLVGTSLFGLGRLSYYQYHFKRCKNKLSKLFGSSDKAFSIMIRLIDKEILFISKNDLRKNIAFIEDQKDLSLRSKIIYFSYFKNFS